MYAKEDHSHGGHGLILRLTKNGLKVSPNTNQIASPIG